MLPASAPSLCTISASSDALDPEFVRVLRISDPGAALDGLLTFAPPVGSPVAAWLQAWRLWRDDLCASVLGPAMLAAAEHAELGQAREIQQLNETVQAALEPGAAARSARAGERLLRRLATSRGERWLKKLHGWAEAGDQPVSLPVIYAAQSALFHLPRRLLVPGYAYWEWIAALGASAPVGSRPDFRSETAALSEAAETLLARRESHAEHPQNVRGGS